MAADICTLAAIRHTKTITVFIGDIIHVQNMEELCSSTPKTFWHKKFQKYAKVHSTGNITAQGACKHSGIAAARH